MNFFKSAIAYKCRALYIYALLILLLWILVPYSSFTDQLNQIGGQKLLHDSELHKLGIYIAIVNILSACVMTAYLALERNTGRLRRILILFTISSGLNLLGYGTNGAAFGVGRYVLIAGLFAAGLYILSRPAMGMRSVMKRPMSKQVKAIAKAIAWTINMYTRMLIILFGIFLLITGLHMGIVTSNYLRPVGIALAVMGMVYILPYYLFSKWLKIAMAFVTVIVTAVAIRLLFVQYQLDLPTLDDVSFPQPPAALHEYACTLAFKFSAVYVILSSLILIDLLVLQYRRASGRNLYQRAGLLVTCAAGFITMCVTAQQIQSYEYPYQPYLPSTPANQEGRGTVTGQPMTDPGLITVIEPTNAPSGVPQSGTTSSSPGNVPTEGTVSNQPDGVNSSSPLTVTNNPYEE